MFKITIDNEEVLCDKDFTIKEEMLNTSSVILNNVFPKTWEQDKDYVSRFYYPKDYSKCKIFEETIHPADPGTTIENSSMSINYDSSKKWDYFLKGQTSQSGTPTPTSPQPINITTGRQVVSVCGKNLFNIEDIVKGRLDSGVIGYASNTTALTLNNNSFTFTTNANYRGVASGYISVGTATNICFSSSTNKSSLGLKCACYDENKNWLSDGTFHNISDYACYFTLANNTKYIRIHILLNSSGTITINNPQIEYGNQATTYEEYKGNDYEINLGKQLLNLPDRTATSNGISYSCTDGTITLNNTATANSFINAYTSQTALYLEAGTYTLSANNPVSAGGSSGQNIIRIMKSNGSDVVSGSVCTMNTINATATFTITEAIVGFMQIRTQSGTSYSDFIIKPQLEKGTGTSYSPYKTPIYLGEMRNTNNVVIAENYIFKNTQDNPLYDSNLEEGQWYIHKEIGRVVLNGSENNWQQWGSQTMTNTCLFGSPVIDNISNVAWVGLSNYFENSTTSIWNTDAELMQINNSGTNKIRFRINKSIASTTSALKTWLSSHNVELYYVLNTPTNTLIEDEELINQLNAINLLNGLNNISVSSANLPALINLHYNFADAYTTEDLLFCGIVKNTGDISLNPRHPHYCNVQVLDFKDFLSQGETLDFVITDKTIEEAIDQVIGTIAPYGFIKGNIELDSGSYQMGAYSTKDKTAYDVFNYIADITQSRWKTRMIDENTIAIDFYDPDELPQGTAIEYTQTWFENNKIDDMSFSYSSNDYRNKQVMLSGEVYSNIETTEIIVADGYQTQFDTLDKIGKVSSIKIDGNPATIITKDEENLGYEGDFIFQPGNTYFESDTLLTSGKIITIVYYAIIEGREIILNQQEIERVGNMTNRKGIIARYENRNDATTTYELQQIGKAYLKYKGTPEISLKVSSRSNIWNIGNRVQFTAPLTELTTEYMVKRKTIERITTIDDLFYEYELTSSFNMERDVNYFDNQRYKSNGNIGDGEFISRNVDINNTANVIFYDLEVNEITMTGTSDLQADLEAPLGVE